MHSTISLVTLVYPIAVCTVSYGRSNSPAGQKFLFCVSLDACMRFTTSGAAKRSKIWILRVEKKTEFLSGGTDLRCLWQKIPRKRRVSVDNCFCLSSFFCARVVGTLREMSENVCAVFQGKEVEDSLHFWIGRFRRRPDIQDVGVAFCSCSTFRVSAIFVVNYHSFVLSAIFCFSPIHCVQNSFSDRKTN